MKDFIDKTTEQNGTPVNRKNLMGIQGFKNSTTSIVESDNITTVTEVDNDDNTTYTIKATDNNDGSVTIVETFAGELTITKTTTIDANGTKISEVLK